MNKLGRFLLVLLIFVLVLPTYPAPTSWSQTGWDCWTLVVATLGGFFTVFGAEEA